MAMAETFQEQWNWQASTLRRAHSQWVGYLAGGYGLHEISDPGHRRFATAQPVYSYREGLNSGQGRAGLDVLPRNQTCQDQSRAHCLRESMKTYRSPIQDGFPNP